MIRTFSAVSGVAAVRSVARRLVPQRASSRVWLFGPALLAGLIGVPLLVVAAHVTALGGEEVRHLAQTVLLRYLFNTVTLVVVVAALAGLIGVATAWLTTAFQFPGRAALSWLLVLPLALPTYIAAFAYVGLVDFTGPVQLFLRNTLKLAPGTYPTVDIQNPVGLSCVLAFTVYPYVYLTARAVFARQSAALLELARGAGYSATGTFFGAVLPLARPAIVAGVMLVAMETLGEFGAAHYFGVDTLTIGIFRAWFALGNVQAALALSAVLLLVVGLIVFGECWQRRRARYHAPGLVERPLLRQRLRGRAAAGATLACAAPVLLGFAVPVAQLFWWAAAAPGQLLRPQTLAALGASVGLAAGAALMIIVLAVTVAYAARLRSGPWVSSMARLATVGYAIPAAVLAVGIATAYTWVDHRLIAAARWLFGMSPGLIITGGVAALLAAYVVRFFAVGYHTIDSGFCRVTTRFDEVARASGLRPRQALLRVGIPNLRPALISAAVLLVVDMLKELPLTMILRPFNLETLATRVFRLASNEMVAESAVLALLIVAIGVLPVIVLQRLATTRRQHALVRLGTAEPAAAA